MGRVQKIQLLSTEVRNFRKVPGARTVMKSLIQSCLRWHRSLRDQSSPLSDPSSRASDGLVDQRCRVIPSQIQSIRFRQDQREAGDPYGEQPGIQQIHDIVRHS